MNINTIKMDCFDMKDSNLIESQTHINVTQYALAL